MTILDKFNDARGPGCAVTVAKIGEGIFSAVRGYANLEDAILISDSSNFRLASVSKQFIAVAILTLLQDKKISLDDTLLKFFPDFPEYGKDITIFHLLTHSSGLRDYELLIPKDIDFQVHDRDVLDSLKKEKDGVFLPGTKYSYSNGGYCLLRLVIEIISGQDIGSFLHEHLFKPLNMSSTTVNFEGRTHISNRAYGYSLKDDQWIRTDQDRTSATIGDGGIYSSITDMQKWDQVFYTDLVLSEEMRGMMLTKHILTDEGNEVYYGFGLCLKDHNGKRVAYHGGSSIGFQAGVYYLLDQKISFIFLSNRTGEEGSAIVEQFADEFLASNRV